MDPQPMYRQARLPVIKTEEKPATLGETKPAAQVYGSEITYDVFNRWMRDLEASIGGGFKIENAECLRS